MNLLLRIALRYSLVAISFVFLMFFILILLDKNPVIYVSNIIFIGPMMAVFLFLSVKGFKDLNSYSLRFWQGFTLGMIFTISFSLLYASFLIVYGDFFDSVYFDEYRSMISEKLMAGKELLVKQIGEDGFEAYLKARESSNKRIIGSLSFNNILIGIVVTPLMSLFMRTTEPKA
ncbi:MAG: hypothetical protein ACJAT1_001768 [Marivirga sp.]|jgi:hypothetical protein